MSGVLLRVNGYTEFDGELGEWVATPPDFIKDRLKPDTRMEPHIKAVMLTITDALLANVSVELDVHTWTGGWRMEVKTGR